MQREHFLAALIALCFAPAIAQAEPTQDDLDRAEIIAADALTLYQSGAPLPAAEKFLEAYALTGRHTQLRNAAKAYEQARRFEEAVVQWERYTQHPQVEPDKRAQALVHIEALRAEIRSTIKPLGDAEHHEGPRLRPRIELDPDDPHTPRDITPPPPLPVLRWGLIGGGSVAAVGGAVLVISGWSTYASFESNAGSVTRAEADAAGTRAGIGYALVDAAVVAGAVLLLGDP